MSTVHDRSFVDAALNAASAGFRVFPVAAGAKNPPLWSKYSHRATTDSGAIEDVWDQYPQANIAIACGGGLVVIDADGPAADGSVRALIGEPTTTVRTPRGRHYYLRGEGVNAVGVLPKIDVRGRGGYVLAPGSSVDGSGRYEWEISPWDVPPIPMPASVKELLRATTKKTGRSRSHRNGKLYRNIGCIHEGERNQTLTSLAGRLRQTPLSPDGITAALRAENRRRCRPPLDDNEIDRIANSATKWDCPPAWLVQPLAFANDDELEPSDRHVLMALCHHANHERHAHPGIDRLAAMTGYSRPTIIAATKRLEKADRIRVTREHHTVNRYRILDWQPRG